MRSNITVNKSGFTLVEVIIVLGVIGIMAAIAAPSIMNWLPNMRLNAEARDLFSAMQRAKIEAVRRNVNCGIVFGQNININGVDTRFEYIVYVDENNNFRYDDGEDIIIRRQQWSQDVLLDPAKGGGDGLTFRPDSADPGNPSIFFKPNTIPTAYGGGFANGTAFLTNSNERTVSIVINNAGNISLRN